MFDVVKLGGSLLSDHSWPVRFVDWYRSCDVRRGFLIVGGGEMIDAMRHLDNLHRLDQFAMHWRCVAMLDHTADIATELLQRQFRGIVVQPVQSLETLAELLVAWKVPAGGELRHLAIVYPRIFYRPDLIEAIEKLPSPAREEFFLNVPSKSLSIGWDTTTDAIAIFAAKLTGAGHCTLLKSCKVDQYSTLGDAAAAGVIDAEVLRMAGDYPAVSLVRL